ncbi:integrase DNA-binding domain-containing protein [Faecalibacterium taiwanense]|uniref:integrase DNA-binding domain-containing protein n=1 Tax=Faecalibacterium taiwanense TaxID=3030638 RepID=UPI00321B0614
MATKARKDSRGYALKKGESQRKDGRYVFRYTTIRGEQKAVYAKELSELRKKRSKFAEQSRMVLTPTVQSALR